MQQAKNACGTVKCRTAGVFYVQKRGEIKMSFSKKQKIATLSVASNTTLIIMKAIAGIMSGSVSILSEAIHSGMDLLAAVIALFSVSVSGRPADKDHPYGHGKVENVSGVIEGLLIFVAAFLIVKEAVLKIIHPEPIGDVTLGIIVMAISSVVNTFVAMQLYKTAKEEDSIALEADALHLKTDVYTSAGVALGLLALKITHIQILDPIIAMCVAGLIIKESWHLIKVAFSPLMDKRLEQEEEGPILNVITQYETKEEIKVDYFKTRKSGSMKFIDFHIYLDPEMQLKESNEIVQRMKQDIMKICPAAHIHINVETI
jgi:cation diffusion facilitator family transporter